MSIEYGCGCGEWSPFQWTYYCHHCQRINCRSCLLDEIPQDESFLHFCPSCLIESTTTTARDSRNFCSRNCVECPLCQSLLTLICESETSYYLSCGFCHWSSIKAGIRFEKPVAIVAQLREKEAKPLAAKEFEEMKQHYETVTGAKRMTSTSTTPRAGLSPSVDLQEDAAIPNQQLELPSSSFELDLASSLEQRLAFTSVQPVTKDQLFPRKVQLKARKTKKCRYCSKALIKPEPKSQGNKFAIKYTIKQSAWGNIPRLVPMSYPGVTFSATETSRFLLKFINPRDVAAKISLSVLKSTITVSVLAASFEIEAFNEMSEYDDLDEEEKKPEPGIFQRKTNVVSIVVDTRPKEPKPDVLEITLQVSVDYGTEKISFPICVRPLGK